MWSTLIALSFLLAAAQDPAPPDPPGSIRIEVLGRDGRPLAGEPIAIVAVPGGRTHRFASTDDRGLASSAGLPPGMYRIYVPERGSERDEVFALVRSGVEAHALLGGSQGPRLSIAGIVRAEGSDAIRADVRVTGTRWPRRLGGDACETGADGRFVLSAPSADFHEFVVRPVLPRGSGVSYRYRRTIDASNGVLDLELPDASVSGLVLGAEGVARAGLRIARLPDRSPSDGERVLEWASTTSDDEGRFELRWLPRAPVVLEASPAQPFESGVGPTEATWCRVEVNLSQGDVASLRIELPPAGRCRGVARSEDGRPIANAWVLARERVEAPSARHLVGRTDDGGHFRTSGLPEGELELWIEEGAISTARRSVTVVAGSTVQADLRAVPSAALELFVEDGARTPLAFRVRVLDADGRALLEGGPFDEPSFAHEVASLPLGEYEIEARDFAGRCSRSAVRIDAAGPRRLVLPQPR